MFPKRGSNGGVGSSGGGGSSGGVKIRPCYDGRLLPGLHQVAGEGLSAISVKQNHRHCKFISDAQLRRPLVTCNQTIDKRNSFWDLLKPDLRKIKGLECSTSGSVAELFRAHNVQNAGKPTYRKRMLRLLEYLVVKKSKTSAAGADVLLQNRHWTERQSVLAALVQEKEMNSPRIVSLHSDFSSTQPVGNNNKFSGRRENTVDSDTVDTLFISQLKEASMLTNSSYNAFLGGLEKDTEFSDGGISLSPFTSPLRETSGLDTSRAPCISAVPSCLRLENKQPLPHIAADINGQSQCCGCDYNTDEKTCDNTDDKPLIASNELKGTENIKTTIYVRNDSQVINQRASAHSASSSAVINKLENKMFGEMQETENYVTSYTSPFYTQEEEFPYYQALTKKYSEEVKHFFEGIRSSAKVSLACPIPELISNNEESLNKIKEVKTDTQVHNITEDMQVQNLTEYNQDAFILSHSSDSGIDLSGLYPTNKNFPSVNLIDFNEDNQVNRTDLPTDISTDYNGLASENLMEFDEIFYNESQIQNGTLFNLEHEATENEKLFDEVFHRASCSNGYWNELNCNNGQQSGISGFDETFIINNANAINGFCIWEESNVAMDTGLCSGVSTKYSNKAENLTYSNTDSALIPRKFIEDVWKEYSEAIYQEALLRHVDECELSYDGHMPSYENWTHLYNQEVYKEAEALVHSIENFIENECAPISERGSSNPYSCNIVEIQDYIFPQNDHLGENLYASEGSSVSSSLANINYKDNKRGTVPNEEVFKAERNESQYSQDKDKIILRNHSNLFIDNRGDIDIDTIEVNTTPTKEIKHIDLPKSRFVQVSENNNNLDNENIQMIFTSPNVQINLTNPIVNPNKNVNTGKQ